MGALQKIRSKSTLLVAVIAVGLLAFVVPWNEIFQAFNMSKDKAFVVNGTVIKTREYSQRIEQAEDLEKANARNGQLDEDRIAEIKEQVFQSMVSEHLLAEQAEKLGLAVTDAEMNDMATGFNVSPVLFRLFRNQQTGQFDQQALDQYLSAVNEPLSTDPQMRAQQEAMRLQWVYIEDLMRFNRLSEKYAALMGSALLINDLEAKSYYEGSKNTADIAYVASEYSTIEDASVEITDSEIQDLYNIRKENFLSKYPSKSLTYFVKEVLPSEEDYNEIEEQALEVKKELLMSENPAMLISQYSNSRFIDAHFAVNSLPVELKNFVNSSNVGDVHGPTRGDNAFTMYKYVSKVNAPDSVKIQVLPIQVFDPALALNISDSLQTVLKKGKSFADLAKEMYPETPQVGIAEWATEADLAMLGIADKCFGANKGEVIKVQIQGMTALVKIDDKTKPVFKAKVGVLTMPVIVSDRTNNTIDNEINQFLSENKEPENFVKAALNAGYNVIENALIYPNQPTLADVASTREVIRWAFNESKGEIKKFETKDTRILAMVTGATEKGYLPVTNAEVRKMLKNELMTDKKAEKLIAELSSKKASSIADLAKELNTAADTVKFVTFQTNNISGVGYEPVMNVYSKHGIVNSLTKPLKGLNSVYVLDLVDKKEDTAEFNEAMVKNILERENSQMIRYSASTILMNKMNVEDNRIKFY